MRHAAGVDCEPRGRFGGIEWRWLELKRHDTSRRPGRIDGLHSRRSPR